MDAQKLKEIIKKHEKWLKRQEGGERADLCEADLRGADLRVADLSGADLSGADLRVANLYGADLSGADLSGANLYGADLCEADLRGAENVSHIPMACPDTGPFIGWKKASGHIVKLLITKDARRSSGAGRKCRCNKAIVLEIQKLDGRKADIESVSSDYDQNFIYKIGDEVTVNDFSNDRFQECAPGIHFFINRQEAVDYVTM